jgi:hypothetical protein
MSSACMCHEWKTSTNGKLPERRRLRMLYICMDKYIHKIEFTYKLNASNFQAGAAKHNLNVFNFQAGESLHRADLPRLYYNFLSMVHGSCVSKIIVQFLRPPPFLDYLFSTMARSQVNDNAVGTAPANPIMKPVAVVAVTATDENNNSPNSSFTSATKMDRREEKNVRPDDNDSHNHKNRMRMTESLIEEDQESKDHCDDDIPNTASRVTDLLLDDERYEDDSYFDDRYSSGVLSPESQRSDDDDFIRLIYDTVDGPCQGVLPVCQMSMEQQLDLFTHCRQPLSFLSLFREHNPNRCDGSGYEDDLPMGMGMYVVPTFCEYCQAENTSECKGNCQRPKLYLQKKRPPFSKPNRALWDPATDNAIPQKQKEPVDKSNSLVESPRRKSWVSDLFGNHNSKF